jgi:hypothetical protein
MKSFSEKMNFSKIFFGVWCARKHYKRRKCDCSQNPATSGRCCRIPTSMFGRILAILARSDWINCRIPASFNLNLVSRHSATVTGCRRIPAPSVFWWPNVAGFRGRLDSENRPLLDSGNRISNMCARTKSLISENDLRF